MKRSNYRFFHRLRVRWVEVDMQKIVFNGHYLMYFDSAISGYWSHLALPYETAFQALGGEMYVKKATVQYHASALMDDNLDIGMKCSKVGNSSMVFNADIFRGDKLLISGELIYVFADPIQQTSKPVPQALRHILEGYEAGESMVELKTGSWHDMQALASPLRIDVFVKEQEVPIELEWDELDATALHAVVMNRLGQGVATGRLLQAAPGVAQIGRMAVHKALRGSSLGQQVMLALEQAAHARGDVKVMLHAQRSAEGFYHRLGYVAHGEAFDDAGIEHIEMSKNLTASNAVQSA